MGGNEENPEGNPDGEPVVYGGADQSGEPKQEAPSAPDGGVTQAGVGGLVEEQTSAPDQTPDQTSDEQTSAPDAAPVPTQAPDASQAAAPTDAGPTQAPDQQ